MCPLRIVSTINQTVPHSGESTPWSCCRKDGRGHKGRPMNTFKENPGSMFTAVPLEAIRQAPEVLTRLTQSGFGDPGRVPPRHQRPIETLQRSLASADMEPVVSARRRLQRLHEVPNCIGKRLPVLFIHLGTFQFVFQLLTSQSS